MKEKLSFLVFLFMFLSVNGQVQLNLYPNGIPNSIPEMLVETNSPEFWFYKPVVAKSNKVFLIIPGGGYARVAMNHEGHDVAKRLMDSGYASFVLRYRLPVDSQMIDKRIAPIQDAQSALVFIRTKAEELGIDASNVVVVGFSAGGHLASTLSTHFDKSYIGEVDLKWLRPDYSVLVYPVISMKDKITHNGSRKNLIGPEFSEEDVLRFSNELNVTEQTPPAFLVHAEDDVAVPIQNSHLYMAALDSYKINNKLVRFDVGGHGFGMYNSKQEGDWFADMLVWLNAN